jgi:replication initiation and membrane attachment protein
VRNILPADTYKVFNRAFIENREKDVIVSLYQPIIGVLAVNLYLTLTNDLNSDLIESDVYSHQHLIGLMGINLDEIVKARKKLEAIGLLKTFFKEDDINSYIYVLYAPLSASDFLNHPILNVVLYNNLGKAEYDNIVEKYRSKKIITKDFTDITTSFDKVFTSVNGYAFDNSDIVDEKTRKIEIDSNIDINLIISSIPNRMVNAKCFNKETIDLIINLAYIYKIDNLNMQGLVRNSINERGMVDKEELKNACRNFYQFENNGKLPTVIYNKQPEYLKEPVGNSNMAKMIYTFENVSPYEFLKNSYNNAEPTARDKKIIENLMLEQKLSPGVVNVLIDYVLRINNKKLNKEFIEAIAGQWKRLNVETVKEAMEICRKEHKKVSKTITKPKKEIKETNLPEWFDKSFEKDSNKLDELKDVLKDFE